MQSYFVSYWFQQNGTNGLGSSVVTMSKKVTTDRDIKDMMSTVERDGQFDAVVILNFTEILIAS